ncbi:LacI family DNA-binding transcriptional regulator [Stappia stellulata]|uniref:LacI family DNA-binding transcriptional regulator n=1 Tax=Stappia stellulata TaxID=71235 RepID=UPI0009FF502C|nr:LacI family DNA-binding transcriptional regulator [Stappia stellulata]
MKTPKGPPAHQAGPGDRLPAKAPAGTSGKPRGARRLTLGDMADALGVSTATVSLALRDSPLVAPATRARIKAHALAAGYVYNRSAAALRTARSNMIGVAVHDILNPYFAEVFRALEDELGRENQVVLICNHRDDVTRQTRFVETLMQHRVDGLVICASVGTQAKDINALADSGLPVTLICRDVAGARVPVVRSDDVAGARMVVAHLVAQGHRNIAMIGGRRQSSSGHDRNLGWKQALEAAGIDAAGQLDIPELMTAADGRDAVARLLRATPRPTAVFAFNDLIAHGLLSALRRAGVEPGKDIAVAGYDDTDGAASRTPALTSVWNKPDEIGRIAAALMLRQISGAPVGPAPAPILPELRVRESTPSPRPQSDAPAPGPTTQH